MFEKKLGKLARPGNLSIDEIKINFNCSPIVWC